MADEEIVNTESVNTEMDLNTILRDIHWQDMTDEQQQFVGCTLASIYQPIIGEFELLPIDDMKQTRHLQTIIRMDATNTLLEQLVKVMTRIAVALESEFTVPEFVVPPLKSMMKTGTLIEKKEIPVEIKEVPADEQ